MRALPATLSTITCAARAGNSMRVAAWHPGRAPEKPANRLCRRGVAAILSILLLSLLTTAAALAQSPASEAAAPAGGCSARPEYQQLDFWLGDWDVYVGTRRVGQNRIEKILAGCAIMENWRAADGGEGKSLFFVDYDGRWAQIWVTEQAPVPGGTKEKVMVSDPPEGAVRFQGVVRHPDEGAWLDRTTLTALEDGTVHQLIEISRDNGETWNPTFDAVYRRTASR